MVRLKKPPTLAQLSIYYTPQGSLFLLIFGFYDRHSLCLWKGASSLLRNQPMPKKKIINIQQLEKRQNATYPDWLKNSYSYTSFTDDPGGFKISGLKMGTLELEPRKTYPAHSHEASEIYVVLEGVADWYINEENFQVREGDVLYHPSGAVHGWKNISDSPLKMLWVWWDESISSEQLKGIATLTNGFSSPEVQVLPYNFNLRESIGNLKK